MVQINARKMPRVKTVLKLVFMFSIFIFPEYDRDC